VAVQLIPPAVWSWIRENLCVLPETLIPLGTISRKTLEEQGCWEKVVVSGVVVYYDEYDVAICIDDECILFDHYDADLAPECRV